jgi:hypothetical protein
MMITTFLLSRLIFIAFDTKTTAIGLEEGWVVGCDDDGDDNNDDYNEDNDD